MTTEILLPMIERKHCVDLVFRNIEMASKPKDVQALAVISASDNYVDYVDQRMKKIFERYRIIRNPDSYIDHSEIRKTFEKGETWVQSNLNQDKIEKVSRTFQLLRKSVDTSCDYFWTMEDDNLFPLNTYNKYTALMEALDADVVAGVSYSWNVTNTLAVRHNFWKIDEKRVFPEGDACNDMTYVVSMVPYQTKGVYTMGATGNVNVFMKREVMLSWTPKSIPSIGSAADCSFWINAKEHDFRGFGMWDVHLPHITKYSNGNFQIIGQIDKTLLPLFGGQP